MTPLIAAASLGHVGCCQALIAAGANVNAHISVPANTLFVAHARLWTSYLTMYLRTSTGALCCALQHKQVTTRSCNCWLLLEPSWSRGNGYNNHSHAVASMQASPLHAALTLGLACMLHNPPQGSHAHRTALALAAANGHHRCVRVLLKAGADKEAVNRVRNNTRALAA